MVTEFTESNIQEMKSRLSDAQRNRRMDLQTEVLFDTINKHADKAERKILCEKTVGNVKPYYPNTVVSVEPKKDEHKLLGKECGVVTVDEHNAYDTKITWKAIGSLIFVLILVIAILYLIGIILTYGWL